MDQGIISTFKAVLLRLTFEWLLDELDSDKNTTVPEIWKKYTMDFIRRWIEAVEQKTLAGCWKNLCPVGDDVIQNSILYVRSVRTFV